MNTRDKNIGMSQESVPVSERIMPVREEIMDRSN